jgi:hypothetical protein
VILKERSTSTGQEGAMTDEVLTVTRALGHATTQNGRTLADLNGETPLLLVCLSDTWTPFARDALAKLRGLEAQVEREGGRVVLVHAEPPGSLESIVRDFRLEGVDRVHDPGRWLLRALRFWRGGAPAASRARDGVGIGGPVQDPGIFLVHRGEIVEEYPHSVVFGRRGGDASAARRTPSPS